MRNPLVFGVLFAAGLVLMAAFYLKSRLVTAPPMAGPRETARAAPARAPALASEEAAPSLPFATPLSTNAPPIVPSEDRQEAIEAEVERLEQVAMNDDSASLSDILQALTSPEQEIRQAAIEATKQFGSTNAIPALKTAAENAKDFKEKIAVLEAVEFLSLPPATFEPGPMSLTPEQQQAEAQRLVQRQLRRQTRLSESDADGLDSPVTAPAPPPSQQP